ncbi:sporulation protein [Crossiella sp. SN42]|uniref:sporulation protein n=1 Tax=Crossiella sp. SN42 TaxID=2944808 RepID=UPI00207C9FBE|nr:sporulation protein [Crossiella sp. SN42]MCO1576771.1 sporulation protein [Crossiella sp. SN42]
MFNKMLGAFGRGGGPTVTTVPQTQHVEPGQVLGGAVHLRGGRADVQLTQVALVLTTQVATPGQVVTGEFHRMALGQAVHLPAFGQLTVPFVLSLPAETPVTAVGPAVLPGVLVELRAEAHTTGAPAQADPVPLLVQPLDAQDRVLDAVGELGLSFRDTQVVAGRLPGAVQELDFIQRMFFLPPEKYHGRLREIELTFVAGSRDLVVSLIADREPELARRHTMSRQEALTADWPALLGRWLEQAAARDRDALTDGLPPAPGSGPGLLD